MNRVPRVRLYATMSFDGRLLFPGHDDLPVASFRVPPAPGAEPPGDRESFQEQVAAWKVNAPPGTHPTASNAVSLTGEDGFVPPSWWAALLAAPPALLADADHLLTPALSIRPPALLAAKPPTKGEVAAPSETPTLVWPKTFPAGATAITAAEAGDLAATLRAWCVGQRVQRVLCVGGAGLFRALLAAGLVHDLCLRVVPRVDGRRELSTLSGVPDGAFLTRSGEWRLRRMEPCADGSCVLHYTAGKPQTDT